MGWPLRHRVTSLLTYAVFIAIPRILALITASLPLVDMFRLLPHLSIFHAVLASCSFATVVTTIAYITLWLKVRKSSASAHERSRRKGQATGDHTCNRFCHFPIYLAALSNQCTKYYESLT